MFFTFTPHQRDIGFTYQYTAGYRTFVSYVLTYQAQMVVEVYPIKIREIFLRREGKLRLKTG